ncbi:hypothetical protein HYT26_01110 [Candidatus Pacearchaeota archaeon]|nr:hypothetical protein [Candidatus Pacearchaeota archaeon]
MFLESNFAYAVYDFLECKKEAGKYNRLRKICGEETLRELEEIAKEAFSLEERKTTRRILTGITNNDKNNKKILNDLDEVFKYHIFLFYKG